MPKKKERLNDFFNPVAAAGRSKDPLVKQFKNYFLREKIGKNNLVKSIVNVASTVKATTVEEFMELTAEKAEDYRAAILAKPYGGCRKGEELSFIPIPKRIFNYCQWNELRYNILDEKEKIVRLRTLNLAATEALREVDAGEELVERVCKAYESGKCLEKDDLRELDRLSHRRWRIRMVEYEARGVALSPYEQSLLYWQALWNLIERSDVLLNVVDARCPHWFVSEALREYVHEMDPKKEVSLFIFNMILVNLFVKQSRFGG